MGCFGCLASPKTERLDPLVVLILGLDGAGKTSVLLRLKGDPTTAKKTSWGFTTATLPFSVPHPNDGSDGKKKGKPKRPDVVDVTFYDIGGDKKIRGIWKNYYAEAYGCIYVVDASSPERAEEAGEALCEVYADEKMKGKPLLILANKQDLPGVLSCSQLREVLKLPEGADAASSGPSGSAVADGWWVDVMSCATDISHTTQSAIDLDLVRGTHIPLLLRAILSRHGEIHPRCLADTHTQKQSWDADRQEQKKRVEALRADAAAAAAPTVVGSAAMDADEQQPTVSRPMSAKSREKAGNTIHPDRDGGEKGWEPDVSPARTADEKGKGRPISPPRAATNTVAPLPLEESKDVHVSSSLEHSEGSDDSLKGKDSSKSKLFSRKKTEKKKGIDKSMIGGPSNFQHVEGYSTQTPNTVPVEREPTTAETATPPPSPPSTLTDAVYPSPTAYQPPLVPPAPQQRPDTPPPIRTTTTPSPTPPTVPTTSTPTPHSRAPSDLPLLPAIRGRDLSATPLGGIKLAKPRVLAPLDEGEAGATVHHVHALPPVDVNELVTHQADVTAPWDRGTLGGIGGGGH
ncbi:ADP-ribosylation factor-like protein 13B [Thoreauomyces humboldtii]|nr:ADP-ribosylation factor-like protein 13B [Thoreauomyces humboldtii]